MQQLHHHDIKYLEDSKRSLQYKRAVERLSESLQIYIPSELVQEYF